MAAQKGIRRRWFRLVQGLVPLLGTCTLKVSQYPGRKGANVATAETYGRGLKNWKRKNCLESLACLSLLLLPRLDKCVSIEALASPWCLWDAAIISGNVFENSVCTLTMLSDSIFVFFVWEIFSFDNTFWDIY